MSDWLPEPLRPGSPAPTDPTRVELLLRLVPHFACLPEIEAALPDEASVKAVAGRHVGEQVRTLADPDMVARARVALQAIATRATSERNGGQLFLAGTLDHFLESGEIPVHEHPFIVALYARALGAANHAPVGPGEIGVAIEAYAVMVEPRVPNP